MMVELCFDLPTRKMIGSEIDKGELVVCVATEHVTFELIANVLRLRC